MSGFDERPVYFSDAFGSEEQADEREVNRISAKKRFREFIREFHEGTFSYAYRWAKWRAVAWSMKLIYEKEIILCIEWLGKAQS